MKKDPHILLVDDDQQVVRYLQRILEGNGYAVTATTSGREALEIIQQGRPDLLILDLNMPEPDGFEVLKTERSTFPHLKILVISGYLTGTLLEAARVFGAVATLEKPVLEEVLVGKVHELLRT